MRAARHVAGWLLAIGLALAPAAAQERVIRLVADARLESSGLLKYLLPRFSLKHRVRVEVTSAPPDGLAALASEADAILAPVDVARVLRANGAVEPPRPAFYSEGSETENYVAAQAAEAAAPDHAATFLDWLTSEIGQRTIAAYAPEGGARFAPGALRVEATVEIAEDGDADEGEKLAYFHCGRCHVISSRNRFGGIGSTPSFPVLRGLSNWRDRFQAFWSLNPHPSFTRVEGVTPPFNPDRPPHIAPVELTLQEVEAIVAFAASITPKDLGRPLPID